MGFFDFLKGTSSQSAGQVKKEYVGNTLRLTFPTSRGNVTVKVNSAAGPGGSRGVMYDCFLLAMGQWVQQGMEESEFISDIKKVVDLIANGTSTKDTLIQLLSSHVSKSGRIIDSDLCTYVTEIYLATTAVNGSCNRDRLLDESFQVAERHFGSHLYVTQYRKGMGGIQPYLVSFADYVRNK